jgi:hypothetical protein
MAWRHNVSDSALSPGVPAKRHKTVVPSELCGVPYLFRILKVASVTLHTSNHAPSVTLDMHTPAYCELTLRESKAENDYQRRAYILHRQQMPRLHRGGNCCASGHSKLKGSLIGMRLSPNCSRAIASYSQACDGSCQRRIREEFLAGNESKRCLKLCKMHIILNHQYMK